MADIKVEQKTQRSWFNLCICSIVVGNRGLALKSKVEIFIADVNCWLSIFVFMVAI